MGTGSCEEIAPESQFGYCGITRDGYTAGVTPDASLSPPRLVSIDRRQLVMRTIDVERLIEDEHSAGLIWELVGRLDLTLYHDRIAAVEGHAGREHTAPQLLISVGPGRWSGQSGKELVLAEPFLHPETERRATEVSRFGSGVWLERRSLAWLQVPCAEQWLTVGASQLIPFGRVPSIAQLGRCLQLRKRATSEQETGR